MKLVKKAAGLLTAAVLGFSAAALDPAMMEQAAVQASAAASDFSYPVQQFRMGIADTNRNVNISEAESGAPVTSDRNNGTSAENWYLNYISAGVYEIVSADTGLVLTAESGSCTVSADTDAANQRWNITSVQKDFEGFDLYYKITSNADSSKALTFTPDTNSFSMESYSGAAYQKYKLNLKGLEGFAANAKVSGGEKAGTIGGLLGETVFVDTTEECVAAMKRTEPLTIVLTANVDFSSWSKEDQKIEDDKTILGSYSANIVYDTQWRNDDFYGSEDKPPSNNIVIQNLHLRATKLTNNSGVILVYIYCGRNVWFDHNDFSATFAHDKDNEVGKFIWINTPVDNWSDGCYNGISPDYITVSYNHFNNRYWTVAYGTQNTETTRDRTTLMFNKWEQCARRTPQIGNGTGHIYNDYHTYSGGGASSQIIGGDGSKILSENCYFEGLSGLEIEGGGASNSPYRDNGSVTAESVDGDAWTMNKLFSYSHTWNPGTENYGYSLIPAIDTKVFCNTYSGSVTKLSDMKHITDNDLAGYVMKTYPCPFLKDIECGELAIGKEAAFLNTANTYTFRNAGSGLYLTVADGTEAAGTDVIQNGTDASAANTWTLKDGGDGYYYILSCLGDGKTYFLDLANGAADNGTNIGIWTDTKSDAQLFKFVDNGDGTYQIVTKATRDQSVIGIVAGSTEAGASAVQWKYDGSANQKWIPEIQGSLITDLTVNDGATAQFWSINDSAAVGDLLYGDREAAYLTLPEALIGAEAILTSCDAKYIDADLASFTAGADITVYVALDERVTAAPAWLADWILTDMTTAYNTDFSFKIYNKAFTAGEVITLGTNGQSASCVNYTVFVTEQEVVEPTTETTTEATTTASETSTETTTTAPVSEPAETTTSDIKEETLYGDVNTDNGVSIVDVIMLNKHVMGSQDLTDTQKRNADCNSDGKADANDSLIILKHLVDLIPTLPVAS